MFCTKCGNQISDGAAFCSKCGTPQGTGNQAASAPVNASSLLNTLSEKVKTEAIIWSVIAVVQVIFGLILLSYGESSYGTTILVIAAINFISAYGDFQYSKTVKTNPKGIVEKYQPIMGLIISLGYNLIFGGVIGVAGILFGFATRQYVMDNAQAFKSIEEIEN